MAKNAEKPVALGAIAPSGTLRRAMLNKLIDLLRPSVGQLGTYAPRPLASCVAGSYGNEPAALPVISVVVPSYNQGVFLRNTLRSLLEEQYPRLELIVVDGGSSDDSVSIVREHASNIAWWVSEPDNGQTHAINKGFQHASGEIMAWLNADDMIVPGALRCVANAFERHRDADVLYGDRIVMNAMGQEIGRWILPRHSSRALKWFDYVPQETLYWRRRAWKAVGGRLDERFRFAMDWDLLLRFERAGLCIRHLPRYLGLFRVHPEQKTNQEMATIGQQEMRALRLREVGYCPSRLQIARHTAGYLLAARWVEWVARFRSVLVMS